jgi:hypothetical protein
MIDSFKQAEPTAHAAGVAQSVEKPRQSIVVRVAEPEVQNQWMHLVTREPKKHDIKRSYTTGGRRCHGCNANNQRVDAPAR